MAKKRLTFYAEYGIKNKRVDTMAKKISKKPKEKESKYLNPEYVPTNSSIDGVDDDDNTDIIDRAIGKEEDYEQPARHTVAVVALLIAIACIAALGLYVWINALGANSYACGAGMTTTEHHFDVCYCGASTVNGTWDENRTWRNLTDSSEFVCSNNTNYSAYTNVG